MPPGNRVPPPYRVLRKLGQGSMAEVLLADLDGRRVAVKRVLPPLRKNAKVLALFREEALLLARLRHPNIPALVADDASGVEPWLALEYVDGVDLAALLRAQPRLPEDAATTIARALALALAHAHALRDDAGAPMRVVHRDVTPSNVLLGVDGVVKLADFGVARHDARPKMTKTGALVGKLTYMAPEQLRGAKVDARTDVFGWGVVAWEMLTGVRPFERTDAASLGSTTSTTLTSLAAGRRGLDGALVALIERSLELDPARRPADGAALVHALGAETDAAGLGDLVRGVAGEGDRQGEGEATLVDETLTDPAPTAPIPPTASTAPRPRRRR